MKRKTDLHSVTKVSHFGSIGGMGKGRGVGEWLGREGMGREEREWEGMGGGGREREGKGKAPRFSSFPRSLRHSLPLVIVLGFISVQIALRL